MKNLNQVMAVLLLSIGSLVSVVSVASESIFTAAVTADFEDVRIDIESAIANRGYVVDFQSNIGEMLDRTAADVGSDNPVFKQAQTWQFCSSILSRKMVEANPANIAHCPYIVFAYETIEKPGTVVIGFRPHVVEDDASTAIFAEINAQLESIVKEVVE